MEIGKFNRQSTARLRTVGDVDRCLRTQTADSGQANLVGLMTDFAGEFRALLAERGMSLRQTAREVPCDSGYLSKLAHGFKSPSPRMAARLEEILGADGRLIRHVHREPDDSEQDDMRRRELLRALAIAGAAMAAGAVGVDAERLEATAGQRLDKGTISDLAALNMHLWQVFMLARSKSAVSALVRDQLSVITDWLQHPQHGEVREQLCELASDLFQLAGEVAFDGNQYTDAAHCYTLAATAAREANASDLWACALTRHAFISVYERQYAAAAPMLDLAAGIARNGDRTLSTRYWVAAVQAETHAGLGNLNACQAALDAADRVRELDGAVHNGGWLRFDGSRLAEQQGTCYATLGRPGLAEAALTAALTEHLSFRRRASVHTGLAMVGVQRRDTDLIIEHAGAAMKIAQETSSGVVARQLQGLRPQLEAFLGNRAVRDLHDQVASLPGTSRI